MVIKEIKDKRAKEEKKKYYFYLSSLKVERKRQKWLPWNGYYEQSPDLRMKAMQILQSPLTHLMKERSRSKRALDWTQKMGPGKAWDSGVESGDSELRSSSDSNPDLPSQPSYFSLCNKNQRKVPSFEELCVFKGLLGLKF